MKNVRAIVIIVIALTIAVAAVLFAQQWLKDQQGLATREVVVAKVNIDIGSRLNPEMLTTVNWPAGSVPEGAYLKEKMGDLLKDPESQQPRVVRISLQRGEPILASKLAPSGEKAGLTAVIPQGKRAMTVSVNEVIGVAGFALPGSYVDIIVNTTDEQNKQLSRIVLEHILVLAVAQQKSRDETEPQRVSSVTLEVTPEEAEKIDLARSVGTLTLVLRSQVDKDVAITKGATKQALLKFTPPEITPASTEAPKVVEKKVIVRVPSRPKQPRAPRSEEVEVIKGVEKSAQQFRANESTQ